MRHHAFAAATGLLAAALLAPGTASYAASADPTGYWKKPDAEREAKIQVSRCGKGLCAKIVWLREPNDSRGRPLQDIRNSNPAQRGRTIVGLPLFSGFTPTGPATWAGKIYNPEDGNVYSATLTMVSKKQIVLKGCKAWLLCGEKIWLRTSAPPAPEPDPEPQIEASAEPAAPTATAAGEAKPETASAAMAGAIPASEPASPSSLAEETEQAGTEPQPETPVAKPVALMTPAAPPADHAMSADGYQFLNASTAPAEPLSGENVSSMLVMTKPLATEPAAASSEAAAAPPKTAGLPADSVPDAEPAAQAAAVPVPNPKPAATHKPAAMQATAAAAPAAIAPKPTAPTAAPAPQSESAQQSAEAPQAIQAGTVVEAPPPLTRRERRLLRRQQQQQQQQQPLLPWLR
jgi:uncharacterized protein (DUF2147 family)